MSSCFKGRVHVVLHPRLGSLCLGRDFGSPFETDPIITSNLEVNFDETKKMYTDQEKSSFTLYCRGAGTEVHRDCVVFCFAAKICPHALYLL